ncbi:MAG: NAD(+) diphosphatase [Pseudomonadota bacterium]
MLKTPTTFLPLLTAPAQAEALTFLFNGNQLLLRQGELTLPGKQILPELPAERVHPVGLWQDRYYQVAWTDSDAVPDPNYAWHGLRSLFGVLDGEFLGLAGRACQLAEWARTHRYCGACATPMVQLAGERCYKCPACNMTAYPRISPAMMVLIRKGDSVLLAMHTQSPYKRYTALAGFLEAGESVEEAVHREVYEEVGLRVHNLRYFDSQSWPFPHSLMLAFTADYLDGEIRVDASEIADARWFGPDDEWPEMTVSVSIAAALLNAHRPPGR